MGSRIIPQDPDCNVLHEMERMSDSDVVRCTGWKMDGRSSSLGGESIRCFSQDGILGDHKSSQWNSEDARHLTVVRRSVQAARSLMCKKMMVVRPERVVPEMAG